MTGYIEYPPQPTGDTERDIRALYAYLYQLCENLNVTLNNITTRKEG